MLPFYACNVHRNALFWFFAAQVEVFESFHRYHNPLKPDDSQRAIEANLIQAWGHGTEGQLMHRLNGALS